MESISSQTEAFADALAEVLTAIRKEKGVSQTDLAARSGLTQPHIGYIEQGKRRPTIDSLKRIALALGTSATDLVQQAEARAGHHQ